MFAGRPSTIIIRVHTIILFFKVTKQFSYELINKKFYYSVFDAKARFKHVKYSYPKTLDIFLNFIALKFWWFKDVFFRAIDILPITLIESFTCM